MPLENTDAEERITRETMIGWIEHWGESYDDVRPDDGAMRLANRIIEYNAATETIEALRNPDAVYDELASILQPVLSSMDGTYFAGSEWFAGEVDRMEADRINGEQPEETDGLASEEPRIPFIVESEATAADTDEPPLDELITAATHEYLDSGMTYDGFSEHVRTTWRNAAAYDWSKLMAEPRSTGEWSSDANRLAVLGVTMQFAPESTCMMIASDILAENAPLSLPALRERINTPDGMVNTDLLFSRLIDNGTTPDPARIDMAMGILGPLEANAPTDACYRIIGLKAMLSLAMGDGEKARELAEQAIGYDASDRFASSVLDRLPETDPAMEAANVWENGGHLGRLRRRRTPRCHRSGRMMGVAAAIEGAGIPRMKGPSSCHSQCKWFAVSSPRTPITGRRKPTRTAPRARRTCAPPCMRTARESVRRTAAIRTIRSAR